MCFRGDGSSWCREKTYLDHEVAACRKRRIKGGVPRQYSPAGRLLVEKLECDALRCRRDVVDISTKDFLTSGARLGQNSRFEVEIWSATARDLFHTSLPYLISATSEYPKPRVLHRRVLLSVEVDHQCSPRQNGHGEKGLLIGPITCKSEDAWLSQRSLKRHPSHSQLGSSARSVSMTGFVSDHDQQCQYASVKAAVGAPGCRPRPLPL